MEPRDRTHEADEHATARHIAQVACQLFAERGVDATPVRAIAESAGVTCPTLYYHFRSKEGLAQELVTRPLEAMARSVHDLLEDRGLDPVDRLGRVAEVLLDFSREAPDRARMVYAILFGPTDRGLATEVDRRFADLHAAEAEAVARLAEAGIIDPSRVACLTRALRGQVVITTMDFLYRDGELRPGLGHQFVHDLLLGAAEPAARAALLERRGHCPNQGAAHLR